MKNNGNLVRAGREGMLKNNGNLVRAGREGM
jgi:hypothetical protein